MTLKIISSCGTKNQKNFLGRLEMIFLVLHEEGAIRYQEKRESGPPQPEHNNNLANVKRRLEDQLGDVSGSPAKRPTK